LLAYNDSGQRRRRTGPGTRPIPAFVEPHPSKEHKLSNSHPDLIFAPPASTDIPIRDTHLRFPVQRIFCVGRNYAAHAREMGMAVDRDAPIYFTKCSLNLVMSGATVPYPPGTSDYHHEMELVVAIGKPAFRVEAAHALEVVFGYACGLDMTRRDLQYKAAAKGFPWDTGKDFETSAVISAIVTANTCGHIHSGAIRLSINGEVRQSGDISDLMWSVPELIADLSNYYHLRPGDLIYTGTPAGVGPVLPGDRITGSIDHVGDIALTIGAAE
jgi:fumarylpyruvate hydrolase